MKILSVIFSGCVFITLSVLMTSCDSYTQDDYVEQYVLESFLTSGEPLPPVKVSRTAPLNETYSFDRFAVDGAQVEVYLLDDEGAHEEVYTYRESSTTGIYVPDDPAVLVKPGRRYSIQVVNLDHEDEKLTSSVFVPGFFEVVELNTDTAVYQGPVQFEATFTRGFYPGRQNIYVASSRALDTDNFDLTPFWKDQDPEPGEFERVSSGIVNEGNYDINPDGTLTLKYPWIGIAYYGPNELSVYAIDNNWYDYIRSRDIQGGGGPSLSPGQIENVLWSVEGGIGVFGARTGIRFEVFVEQGF